MVNEFVIYFRLFFKMKTRWKRLDQLFVLDAASDQRFADERGMDLLGNSAPLR
jgi:hypothetical protein